MGTQPAHAPMCSQGTDCLQIAVAEGASGTIRRSADPEVFFHAIRTVSSGNAWYEAGTATAIMRHALAPHTETTSHALSSRELDVAELISVGRSNKEIAQALGISEPTVKKHVGHILDKLGSRTVCRSVSSSRGIPSCSSRTAPAAARIRLVTTRAARPARPGGSSSLGGRSPALAAFSYPLSSHGIAGPTR